MAQYGAGSQYAAQCPVASTPDGWRAWSDADGPVPDTLTKRAQAVLTDESVPLGATESYPLPGVTALIRIEPRVWGRDAQGNPVQGCFRAAGIYLPSGSVSSPNADSLSRAIGVLTAVSLVVGTVATAVTMRRRAA
jgi:hypothetical protein